MKTFVDHLSKQAQNDQTALIFFKDGKTESAQLTYAELNRKAQAIATHLSQHSQPSDRILLLYPPGLEFVSAFCGCLFAGAIAVPLNLPRPKHSLSRIESILKNSEANIALTTTPVLDKLKQQFRDHPHLMALHWITTDDLDLTPASQYIHPNITPETIAFLQYTSGSTGNPKGVMVTHQNLLHNSAVIQQGFQLTPDSVSLSWLPHFHDMGLIDGILQPLYTGFLGLLMQPVTFYGRPLRWLQLISRYHVTHSGGPNFAYQHCLRKITPEQCQTLDLSKWESAYNGAEPIRAETIQQFTERFQPYGFRETAFYPCYGLAEATLMVTGVKLDEKPTYTASTAQTQASQQLVGGGYPRLDTEVKIVNPQTLNECCSEEIGEIWVASDSVAQGYWQQPDISKQSFQAYNNLGHGPFLRTGDLGFIQAEQLYVTGRLKNLLIVNGMNYYPQDIEYSASNAHPALRPDCGAAFSVPIQGQERLVIAQEVNHRLEATVIDQMIGDICQAVMQNHELTVYDIVLLKSGTLPKTSSGKIQHQVCRSKFLAGTLVAIAPVTHPALGKTRMA